MTITAATLLFAPAYWAMMFGLVAYASDDTDVTDTTASAALALGLSVIPFVFIVLAFMSWHPNAAGAVVRGMGLCLGVGIIVSALAADAVTGIVAGVGAGGIVTLRADLPHDWRHRAAGVVLAAAYAFFLARAAAPAVIVAGPAFPLSAIGMADHWSERRRRTAPRG